MHLGIMMSRDVQVRVVFCDWLAWLLRMKKSRRDDSLKSLLDKHQTDHHSSIEDASSDTHLRTINKVFNTELFLYSVELSS